MMMAPAQQANEKEQLQMAACGKASSQHGLDMLPEPAVDTTPYAHCLFQQPWWLDAVAPGAWRALEVEEDGEVVGRLVYSRQRRLGLRVLTQPPLTRFCGPWVKTFSGKLAHRASKEDMVLKRLIEALPPHDVFRQRFHYAVARWLSFHWAGFRQTARLSYVIEDLSDLERIWADFRADMRTNIRKAQKLFTVEPDDNVEVLLDLNRVIFRRQGLDLPYSPGLVRRLDAACAARGQRGLLVARDRDGRPCAASWFAWDEHSAHGLISGVTEEARSTGADSLMVWESIKHARSFSRSFDLGGSMIRNIEHFLRGFSGSPRYYSQFVYGHTVAGHLALAAADIMLDRRRRHYGR